MRDAATDSGIRIHDVHSSVRPVDLDSARACRRSCRHPGKGAGRERTATCNRPRKAGSGPCTNHREQVSGSRTAMQLSSSFASLGLLCVPIHLQTALLLQPEQALAAENAPQVGLFRESDSGDHCVRLGQGRSEDRRAAPPCSPLRGRRCHLHRPFGAAHASEACGACRRKGSSAKEVECLGALAFLHDIGKIAPGFQVKAQRQPAR